MSQTIPAVEVTHLRKVYGSGHTEVVAMRDATLSIVPGEIVGMFGPSGSGKSTLLTAMALINPPTSGQISIGGRPVMDGPRALVDLRAFRRQHLGFVFQKANLIPFLTALENVQIALEVNDTAPKAARKRAMELLDYLGIGARASNLPVALSGGEQQRVAVARALANKPSLILADEPTAALDGPLGRQVMELFAKIVHRNVDLTASRKKTMKNIRVCPRNSVLHGESAKQRAPTNNQQQTNMKTKIAHLTATIFAVFALAPVAFAAPEYGPKPSHPTKDQGAPTCCETGGSCKGKDCCTTKLVSTGFSGYQRHVISTKRVIVCNTNCPVTAKDQRAVCKSGSRA